MTGVRRRGYFPAAAAVLGAALLTALLSAPSDKPVDIRLVAPPPPSPQTIIATAATTVSAVGPVALTTSVPPPPPAAPAKPLPRQSPAQTTSSAPTSSLPRDLFDLLRCDQLLLGDLDRCLDWPFDGGDPALCDFLKQNHLTPADLPGLDVKCE
jgi:hypothetical protein